MILQLTEWTQFSDVNVITVPLVRPSVERSILVAGMVLHGAQVPAIASVRDSTGQRWSCANTTVMPGGRLDVWWTPTMQAGATEIIAHTAGGVLVSGQALALEALVRNPGDAIQYLADVIFGLPRLARLPPPPPQPPSAPDDPDLQVWAKFGQAMDRGAL